ncbi:MAG: Nif11-like leader peptide family natural product precursor [Acidobacteriota bacterium]
MPEADFEAFRHLVLQDLSLQAQLRDEPDQQKFIALAVQLGTERDCHFTADEVVRELQVSRRGWFERWILR